ncbi:hypothetical protein [Streptomyces sp. NBC_00620]|uniref:hypothetical protein n=1 Tax=Streptomyces sp. NBC_00620 TaxID=2903666 RepID=UPI002252B2DA|nr:hypothetical protein [Streptomyces sp. NBC_00620]MCX4976239.1 hypothetical protein [Streptomyces sp. NBC_00620]
MDIERYQPANHDLIPMRAGAPPQEIRALERTARAAIFMTRLEIAIKALRLDALYRLYEVQIEKHIAMGERIASEIVKTDNPLVIDALTKVFDEWERNSTRAISGGMSF